MRGADQPRPDDADHADHADHADDRYRWNVVGVATLTQAASAFVFLGVGTLAAFIQADLDLSGTQAGLLVTAIGLVPLFALLPVGRMLDRYGERWLVGAGALALGCGVAVATLPDSYLWVMALLLVGGTGYATAQPGGSSAVAGWFTGPRRGLAMGIRQTGLPLGGAAAAAILPTVADRYGWQTALVVAGGVAAIGAVLFATVYRDHPRPPTTDTAMLQDLRDLLAVRALRPVLWAGTTHVAVQFATVSYLLPYLRDRHGIGLAVGGSCLFAAQLAGVAGRIVLARWSDSFGAGRRLRPVVLSVLVTAGGTLVLAVMPAAPLPVLIGVMAAYGFFAFGWYGPWVVHVADVAPDAATGLTLAMAMTGNQLGIVAGPPLFGAVADLSGGYAAPWLTLTAFLLVVAGRLVLAVRRGDA